MQSHQPAKPHEHPKAHPPHQAPPKRFALPPMSRRTRLFVIAGAAVVGTALLALLLVNLLISADWVRDRVASRIKEQTGRELEVNGMTALLFTPGPKVIISDAVITDPEERAGTADLSVGRLVLNLSLGELLSRQIDAEQVVLVRPVLTMRLGDDGIEKPKKPKQAKNPSDKPRRDVKLRNIRIEDGAVHIIYDDKGKTRRIEQIAANLSLPALADPFTGSGTFAWKGETVEFSFGLTSLADLRQKRPAKLVLGLDTQAIAARFDGTVLTRPDFTGQGELSAKAHSIPSLLAWMRERPAASTAIGDGELASRVEWKKGEVTFSNARFALEHASGQGQAVVTLKSPRPHIRAALALEHLDLNPFLASRRPKASDRSTGQAAPAAPPRAESTVPRQSPPGADAPQDWFSKPKADSATAPAETEADMAGERPSEATGSTAPQTPSVAPAPVAEPAAFDADVNLNVRKTRLSHLEIGPSSLGLAFRDGILNATLGGMELYDGQARGRLVLDATRPIPAFTGDFHLDGVQAKALLSDAAQISLLEGETKLTLEISGTGGNSEQIKSSLQGQGSLAVSDGAIEGIDLTEMIGQLGQGQLPEVRQGPGAKTAFSDLGGSFTIQNGIAATNNLQMTTPLLKVAASGNVDLTQSTISMLAQSEIVAGPEGVAGANDLAGLSLPVRIEGPLDRPTIRPEIKAMFANPEKAGKTVNKIGKALEKKFKGKPVGEAIGRLLGNVQIGAPDDGDDGAEPKPNRQRSDRRAAPEAAPAPEAPEAEPEPEPTDPELDRILR